jgi:hypothetical protein
MRFLLDYAIPPGIFSGDCSVDKITPAGRLVKSNPAVPDIHAGRAALVSAE